MESQSEGKYLAEVLIEADGVDSLSYGAIYKQYQSGEPNGYSELKKCVASVDNDLLWEEITSQINQLAQDDEDFDGDLFAQGFMMAVVDLLQESES